MYDDWLLLMIVGLGESDYEQSLGWNPTTTNGTEHVPGGKNGGYSNHSIRTTSTTTLFIAGLPACSNHSKGDRPLLHQSLHMYTTG